MQNTGALILAAGLSSRMGSFKPLLPFGGTSMILYVVNSFKMAGVKVIAVVTGHNWELIERELSGTGVYTVKNENYANTAMFSSILLGLEALKNNCSRVLITPVDNPAIKVSTIRIIMESDAAAARPVCEGRGGHPVLIGKQAIPLITSYSGEQGLRGALDSLPRGVENIYVSDPGIFMDADTPEEYGMLKSFLKQNRNR